MVLLNMPFISQVKWTIFIFHEWLPLDHFEKIEKVFPILWFLTSENIKSCIFTAVKIQVFIFSRL